MTGWLDALALVCLRLAIAAFFWFGFITILLLTTRQPGRRSTIGRCGILGACLLIPALALPAGNRLDDAAARLVGFLPPKWAWSSPSATESVAHTGLDGERRCLTDRLGDPRNRAVCSRILLALYLAGVGLGLAR